MNRNLFSGLISVLVGITLCELAIILFLIFNNSKENSKELLELLENQTKRLEESNRKIDQSVDSLNSKFIQVNKTLIKLNESKQSIRIIYVDKIKAIDNFSSDDVLDQFNLFFSKENSSKQ